MVKADLARKTINEHVSRIRRLFKWGVEHELIPETCWRALHAVSGLKRGRTTAKESKPILPIEDTVVAATLPFLSATITAMVKLQRLTGMRPQEVCQIRPGDIDRTTETWRYTPQVHKTQHRGRERVIMIGPKAQEVLLPFLERPDDVFCFSPRETEDKRRELQHLARSTPIGYGNAPGTNRKRSPKRLPGACYSTGSYHKAIKRACEAAGIERWAPNRLRHSFATQVRAEAGIESARIL
jgi:integrase